MSLKNDEISNFSINKSLTRKLGSVSVSLSLSPPSASGNSLFDQIMEVEDYLQEPILQFAMDDNDSIEKPWQKSNSATAKAADNIDDCFQCNICLDHANEPVVTLCGHLYCWPCIYKWLHFRPTSTTTTLDQQPQGCPVCKANVSLSTVVPLYGRGGSLVKSESNNEKSFYPGLEIPNRPLPAHGVHSVIRSSGRTSTSGGQAHDSQLELQPNHHPQEQYNPILHNQTSTAVYPMFNSLGGSTTTTAAVHQIVGMLGEMVYARIFGNGSEMGLFVHPNSSYYLMGINHASPRLRRQEMKAEKSLNRISIFLFCCLVLCLLSF